MMKTKDDSIFLAIARVLLFIVIILAIALLVVMVYGD